LDIEDFLVKEAKIPFGSQMYHVFLIIQINYPYHFNSGNLLKKH